MKRLGLICLVLLGASACRGACGKSVCAEQSRDLGDWLAALYDEGLPWYSAVPLAKTALPPSPVARHRFVHVTPQRGHWIEDYLLVQNSSSDDAEEAPTLALLIEPETSWAVVLEVVAEAERMGIGRLQLVVGATSSIEAPPVTHNTDALKGANSGSDEPAPLMEPVFYKHGPPADLKPSLLSTCPGAEAAAWQMLGFLGPPSDPSRGRDLAKAIEACGCRVDVPAVQNWVWALQGRFEGGPWAAFSATPAAVAAVQVSSETPWQDAWIQLAPTKGP